MAGKEADYHSLSGQIESNLVPLPQKSSFLEELEEITLFLAQEDTPTRTELLRQQFEERYAEQLFHQRRIMQSRPSPEDNPDLYMDWKESEAYLHSLAKDDIRTASIVRRYVTPLDERISRNVSQKRRFNKHGWEVDEYGRDLALLDEDEFAELERSANRRHGVEVPINRFETQSIIDGLEHDAIDARNYLAYSDIIYGEREGGEMYTADGTLVFVEPNLEHQKAYDSDVERVEEEVRKIREVLDRYKALFSVDQDKAKNIFPLPAKIEDSTS